jgi:hypothetical protein
MIQKTLYESPSVEIIETLTEGILCMSSDESGMDMIPEEGNM